MSDDVAEYRAQTSVMPAQGASPTVVIEDDDDLRSEIVAFLQRRKRPVIDCATIADARETLAKAENDAVPLLAVISDIWLRDGDGLELYVDYAPRLPSVRWILMSGAHDTERVQTQLAGLKGLPPPLIVEKPFSLRLLRDLLEDAPPSAL